MCCGSVITVDVNSGKKYKLWISLMLLGSMTGCHQMNERSFFYKGYQFPLCARCTGLLLGQLAGLLLVVFFLKRDIKLLFCLAAISTLLMGIDGIGQLKNFWQSTNLRRVLTGVLCGCFVTMFNITLILALVDFITTILNLRYP